MSKPTRALPEATLPDDAPGMHENLRRNYALHALEGGMFMGALAFLSAETVMPAMIHSLGGPSWLVALMPVMMMLGITWPPLITAHWVERQPRLKSFVLLFGVVQRLPFLVAGLFLFLAQQSPNWLLIAVVALTPLIAGLMNGVCFGAWIELVSRTVPAYRRASLAAFRNIIGALVGLAAGAVVHSVLEAHPGPSGYGLLHLITFVLMLLSLAGFALVRETPWSQKTQAEGRTLASNLRSLPMLFNSDRELRYFLLSRFLSAGYFILIPFLSVHALQVTGNSQSFLGTLVVFGILGQLSGNLLGGFIGDRFGGKLVLVSSMIAFFLMAIGASVNTSSTGFLGIFFLSGICFAMDNIGRTTLSIELSPVGRRATYLSLINTISLPSFLLAALVSFIVRESSSGMIVFSVTSSITMAGAMYCLLRVREPRRLRYPLAASKGGDSCRGDDRSARV